MIIFRHYLAEKISLGSNSAIHSIGWCVSCPQNGATGQMVNHKIKRTKVPRYYRLKIRQELYPAIPSCLCTSFFCDFKLPRCHWRGSAFSTTAATALGDELTATASHEIVFSAPLRSHFCHHRITAAPLSSSAAFLCALVASSAGLGLCPYASIARKGRKARPTPTSRHFKGAR